MTMSEGARLANEASDRRRIENRLRAIERKLDVVLGAASGDDQLVATLHRDLEIAREVIEGWHTEWARLKETLREMMVASKEGMETRASDRWEWYWTGYADAAKKVMAELGIDPDKL